MDKTYFLDVRTRLFPKGHWFHQCLFGFFMAYVLIMPQFNGVPGTAQIPLHLLISAALFAGLWFTRPPKSQELKRGGWYALGLISAGILLNVLSDCKLFDYLTTPKLFIWIGTGLLLVQFVVAMILERAKRQDERQAERG